MKTSKPSSTDPVLRTPNANYAKLYLRDSLINIALYFTTGSVIQTFLSKSGCSSRQIGVYASLLNVVNILASALCSQLPDRSRDIKRPIGLCLGLYGALCFCYLPLCFGGDGRAFAWLLLLGGAQCFILALRTLYEYKLPYRIMAAGDYGRVISVDGMIMCGASILCGLAMSASVEKAGFFRVSAVGFALSGAAMLIAWLVNSAMKLSAKEKPDDAGKKAVPGCSFASLIKNPVFYKLLAPNLLRGLASGIVSIAAVYGISEAGLDDTGQSLIPIAANAAFLSGSALFAFLSSRGFDGGRLCCFGSALMAALPLMGLFGGKLFLAAYFIVSFGLIMVNDAVPYMTYNMVPYEIAASYNTWRMIVTTGGSALSAYLGAALIGHVPSYAVLAAAVVCQAVSAAAYFAVYRGIIRTR